MRKPRFMVLDAPSQAQSIDIEKWKKERNEEMKALSTVTLYKKGGRSINVNEGDVKSYVEMEDGWSIIPVVEKPVATKVTPRTTSTMK